MDKLLMSRRSKQENHQRLTNLSPQKYGKGAYAELTFTPSKLADNILFREASSLKRVEIQNCKNREYQAQNQILIEQVSYLKKERDGISDSLNQIIAMYKGIIAQMEAKNDERIKQIQKKFKQQMQKIIISKEEEAKYFQGEKQILQENIDELSDQIKNLKQQIHQLKTKREHTGKDYQIALNQNKKLEDKIAQNQIKSKQEISGLKQNIENLKKESMHAQVEWKNRLNEQIHKKNKQIETNQRAHKAELQKVQNQRNNEALLKNQQLNQITKTFEIESNRLKQILLNKDKMIQQLSLQNNKEKTRIINLTRDYQAEINLLTHQKNRVIDEVQHLGRENQVLAKDRAYLAGDLESENNNLRDLLLQSSVELEKCKNEFLDLARENSNLLTRLKSAQEEARTWRQSYYINKNRPY